MSFLVAILFFSITFAGSNLPLNSRDDGSLLGPDINKNKVRDDVEIYVFYNFTKDPQKYRAYLNYAQTIYRILENRNDEKSILRMNLLLDDDLDCLTARDNKFDLIRLKSFHSILFNNKARVQMFKGFVLHENSKNISRQALHTDERLKKCR